MTIKLKILAPLLFVLFFSFTPPILGAINKDLRTAYNRGFQIGSEKPKETIAFFDSIRAEALATQDTLFAVKSMMQMAGTHLHQYQHAEALILLSDALLLSEKYNYNLEKSDILNDLATIHQRYGQISNANDYTIKSINIKKDLFKRGLISEDKIIKAYRQLALIEQSKKNYEKALVYLDTCFMLSAATNRTMLQDAYIHISKAKILFDQEKYDECLDILYPLEIFYDTLVSNSTHLSPNTSMQSFVCYYIAEIIKTRGDDNKALDYYTKSYQNLEKHQLHHGNQVNALKKISEIHAKKGNYQEAYQAILESNKINRRYFTTKRSRDSSVISVNDIYKEKLETQEKQLIQNELELAEKEKAIFRFRALVGIIILMVILGALIIRNKIQKIHFEKIQKLEKEKIEQEREYNEQKLRNKNKELTSYTLQLIERDDLLDKFSEFLKNNSTEREAKSLILARKQLNTNNWEEFNKRFVSVNRGFYERLSQKYPELTPTDKKHCALIKLNFSGKEMANLLGISEKSVHMARYRIRKKMKLNTEVNLSTFISSI